jgi:hypothetical protein
MGPTQPNTAGLPKNAGYIGRHMQAALKHGFSLSEKITLLFK